MWFKNIFKNFNKNDGKKSVTIEFRKTMRDRDGYGFDARWKEVADAHIISSLLETQKRFEFVIEFIDINDALGMSEIRIQCDEKDIYDILRAFVDSMGNSIDSVKIKC